MATIKDRIRDVIFNNDYDLNDDLDKEEIINEMIEAIAQEINAMLE